jgi:hypothetical protein
LCKGTNPASEGRQKTASSTVRVGLSIKDKTLNQKHKKV